MTVINVKFHKKRRHLLLGQTFKMSDFLKTRSTNIRRISLRSNWHLEIWLVKLPWDLDLLTISLFYNSNRIVGFKSSLFALKICSALCTPLCFDFRRRASMLYGLGVTTKQNQGIQTMGKFRSFVSKFICPKSKILQFGQNIENRAVT